MKKRRAIPLIIFFIIGLISPSNGQDITGPQKSAIEKQVDAVFHEMVKAAEQLDYDQLNKGVDDSGHAGFIVNGSYFDRYDSLISILRARSQRAVRQHIAITKEKITVLSGSIVLLAAYGDSSVETSSGDMFTVRFYWSFVYKKTGNQWKVIQSHQSGAGR